MRCAPEAPRRTEGRPLEIEHTKMGDAWLPIDHTQALVTPHKRVPRFRSREEFDTWADGAGRVPQKHRGNIR